MNFYKDLEDREIDIMLEVKDKNLSAVKCINCTTENKRIRKLELEWSRYKYSILEKSPKVYLGSDLPSDGRIHALSVWLVSKRKTPELIYKLLPNSNLNGYF